MPNISNLQHHLIHNSTSFGNTELKKTLKNIFNILLGINVDMNGLNYENIDAKTCFILPLFNQISDLELVLISIEDLGSKNSTRHS